MTAPATPGEPAGAPGPATPAKPAGVPGPAGSRYGWFVGVVVVLIVVYISLNTLTTTPHGSRGPTPGQALPPFAVPLALGPLNGDANVALRSDQGAAGRRPACTVRGPQILNACELTERGPLALALFVPAGNCPRALDELVSLRSAFPGLIVAGVAIRGSRADVRGLVRRHAWGVPVGYDHDGAVANLYRLAVCAEVAFALPGGRVQGHALLDVAPVAAVRARLAELLSAARAAGWRPRS